MNAVAVILHCDLDCFYAQVERERLKLPKDAAVAVVQWASALAVSYPARKYGVKRGSTVDDIRRLSGDAVTIVHVETISTGDAGSTESKFHTVESARLVEDARATEKVSLARYRQASARVFSVFADVLTGTGAVIERASIDEAYIDVTSEVERRLRNAVATPKLTPDTHIVGGVMDFQSETDVRLTHGASIAVEIRQAVAERCGYSVSAGVSANKLLAKFASAANKPNQQTIVPLRSVSRLMCGVPLSKLRGLGGKLGRDVEALGVQTAGEAVGLSMEQLKKALGNYKAADFVYKSVRGIDDTPVKARDMPRSLLAAKSFTPDHDLASVEESWLSLLADELVSRLEDDMEANDRVANTLTISFRATVDADGSVSGSSRSTGMPGGSGEHRKKEICTSAKSILRSELMNGKIYRLPISFLGLTACNFNQRVSKREQICNFFKTKPDVGMSQSCSKNDVRTAQRNAEEEHSKRIQEKADRELAWKLHRKESRGSVKGPDRNSRSKGITLNQERRIGKSLSKKKTLKGVATVDSFFKSKPGRSFK